ncbi:MAG: FliM/FliN family flagellar motor switch protein [Parvularculaceae bacterium]
MADIAGSWFLFEDHDQTIIVAISDDLVLAAADFAICQKVSPNEGTNPTAVDRSIATALARRLIVAAFGRAETERKFQPELRAISGNAHQLSLPSVPHGWALFQFAGSLGAAGQAFTVMIGRPNTAPDEKQAPSIGTGPALSQRMRAISISARCIVGAIETPLRQALELKRGDILRLDWRGPHGFPLVAGGKTVAVGSLGEHNGRRAMKIADFSGGADIVGG